jgi:hypothetical protein
LKQTFLPLIVLNGIPFPLSDFRQVYYNIVLVEAGKCPFIFIKWLLIDMDIKFLYFGHLHYCWNVSVVRCSMLLEQELLYVGIEQGYVLAIQWNPNAFIRQNREVP